MRLSLEPFSGELGRYIEQLASRVEPYDVAAAARLREAVSQAGHSVITVAVLGKAKRGKSTLINAILGRRDDLVAPIDRLPASSAISTFKAGPQETATVVFHDDRKLAVPFARIRDYVTEEGNPGNRRDVRVVEVTGAFRGLGPDVVLVDTPGAGSLYEHHDALLYDFIPRADAVIFVVTARMPIDQDELNLLQNLQSHDLRKIFFVLNQVDLAEERDLADAEEHNSRLLESIGVHPETYHRVSAKRAFEGNVADSGLNELIDSISHRIASQRGALIGERLNSRIRASVAPAIESLELKLELANADSATVESELAVFKRKQDELAPRIRNESRRFLAEWSRALHDLNRAAGHAKNVVLREMSDRLEQAPTLSLSSFARALPGEILREWHKALDPELKKTQEMMSRALERLQSDSTAWRLELPSVICRPIKAHDPVGVAEIAKGGGNVVLAAVLSHTASTAAAGLTGVIGTVTSPLWIALGGPVALVLAGAGAVTAYNGWRLSRQRLREQLAIALRDHIEMLAKSLRTEVVPDLRERGELLATELQQQFESERDALIAACEEARCRKPRGAELDRWRADIAALRDALNHPPAFLAECSPC